MLLFRFKVLLHIIVCQGLGGEGTNWNGGVRKWFEVTGISSTLIGGCLLYTSDAADDWLVV